MVFLFLFMRSEAITYYTSSPLMLSLTPFPPIVSSHDRTKHSDTQTNGKTICKILPAHHLFEPPTSAISLPLTKKKTQTEMTKTKTRITKV
uniref:Uncharacterized protein n=1 Tax=Anopheles braziliensis TaxID=58242 RepID=A0A2M3ZL70_9DIPT